MSVRPGGHRLVVLNFHGIGVPPDGIPDDERPFWCPLDAWAGVVDELRALRGEALEITFDDGNSSDVEVALPALAEAGLAATFHVCAGRLGKPGYLDPADARALVAAGMRVGSHGWSHVDLRRLPESRLALETRLAAVRIREASGAPVTRFAVPVGSYDRRVLARLRGYEVVYTSDTTTARPGERLRPRWSWTAQWSPGTVTRLVRDPEPLTHRARQRASMLAKAHRPPPLASRAGHPSVLE